METKNNGFMENLRKINQALIGFEAVSYWIYGIIVIAIVVKFVFGM
jgi:hypothetical protein